MSTARQSWIVKLWNREERTDRQLWRGVSRRCVGWIGQDWKGSQGWVRTGLVDYGSLRQSGIVLSGSGVAGLGSLVT